LQEVFIYSLKNILLKIKIVTYRIFFLSVLLTFCNLNYCQITSRSSQILLPEPINYTSDYSNIFSDIEENKLNNLIQYIEKHTLIEFAIISITNRMKGDLKINEFAKSIGNKWGVGKKYLDNGIIIVINKESREIYIQPGKGIEKIYTTEQLKIVIDETIKPFFRIDAYYEGVFASIIRLTEELKPKLKDIK